MRKRPGVQHRKERKGRKEVLGCKWKKDVVNIQRRGKKFQEEGERRRG